jgi:hypothetical protein
MKRRLELSRRALLRGAGAAIAMPFLEAMVPHGTRGALFATELPPAPQRLVFYYVPNGMHMADWRPAESGPLDVLPPTLEPLAAHTSRLLVLSNLANRNAIDSVAGDHARGTGAFLTARLPTRADGDGVYNGISADQVVANGLAGATPFASLQLGMEGGSSLGDCDSGYSCAYSRNISWASPTTPLPKLTSPSVLFERLFGGADPALSAQEVARRRRNQLSILDHVLEDATRLHARLGASDRARLDEYLTSVRSVEETMTALERESACGTVEIPPDYAVDVPAYSRVMNDLMVLALQCDLTRVVTFMLGNGGSNRTYPWLGVTGAHHEISHHQDIPENFDRLRLINRWEVEQLAHLLGSLESAIEPDGGSLLDRTLVFFSSEISDGNRHNHNDLPVLLAGGGGGITTGGRHVAYGEERPIANLFVSLINAAGVPVDSFGADGTAPLEGLTA